MAFTVSLAIMQLCRAVPSIKVLICAPSNAAADNVVVRLADDMSPAALVRAMAFSRRVKDTPATVLPFTRPNEDGGFVPVSATDVGAVSVVVSTIASAAKLFNAGVLARPLLTRTTKVVLAGNPQQLGPVIKSSYASKWGLDASLMARLMTRLLYLVKHAAYKTNSCAITDPMVIFSRCRTLSFTRTSSRRTRRDS
ncbi:Aste57867_307 [Aphanomyces stellatus]|uniref:Aste57867_307 protein n=1 Tax=Aphanomyces stellatus TaxID=120398 RepID=A0A485K2Q1_9STRA|nr:hypothetical protein As57867_000307 [Aphanomyces stellatus]VFT77533.1 Aste57867_307 [Aphanomyces stellatus]